VIDEFNELGLGYGQGYEARIGYVVRQRAEAMTQTINPKSKYCQYYQTNPKLKIQKNILWDFGFWIYFGFGSICSIGISYVP
jgi:hypothetical protein